MKQQVKQVLKFIIRRANFTVGVSYRQIRFKIPIIKMIGVQHLRGSEPWMTELLEKLLLKQKEGIFVDIGVNLGQTLLKLRSLFPEMEYFGFEPNPVCCFYLEEIVKANGFQNVNIFPVAIGEKPDIVTLYLHDSDDTADSSASLLRSFKDRVINFQKNIPVFPLDFFQYRFMREKPISLLKIDVEGAELEVINSSMGFIRSRMPIISCELLPPINKNTREETLGKKRKIQQLLQSEHYRFFKILKSSKDTLGSIVEVSDIAEETLKREGWDYLFVPVSKINHLTDQFNVKVL